LSGVKPHGKVFAYVEGMTLAELPRPLRQVQTFQHESDGLAKLLRFLANTLAGSEEPVGARARPALRAVAGTAPRAGITVVESPADTVCFWPRPAYCGATSLTAG